MLALNRRRSTEGGCLAWFLLFLLLLNTAYNSKGFVIVGPFTTSIPQHLLLKHKDKRLITLNLWA
jgi:hypothetical protein